jgi:uncharacterized protein YbbC (DUF1343 family)/uncharacterized lipoprotein YddW (UPF0748 family)
MNKKVFFNVFSVLLILSLLGCKTNKHLETGDPSGRTPNAEREFRAAWVATVANINWPSKPGLSVAQQKKEAVELLDLLFKNNFNAVIFQVRPQCDALYQSDLEPWSYYLSGVQGKAPDPFYDPLKFWIDEAHARGIELHAWLNPYRAHHTAGGPVSEASIVKKHPELVVKLEQGYWWMEPTKKAVQDQTYNVVMDLVRRYDLDGIHFDDYFYPYPSYNNDKDFPDEESWRAYQKSGGKLSRGDWRRESVNLLVERIYNGIKSEKPNVKFGLSPFGIWRPNHPLSVSGFDQHNVLYADARKWLNKGWIDYYTPQLYWSINQVPQSYPVLLGWWNQENKKGRHLWPGISLSIQPLSKLIDENINQVMIARGMLPTSPGVVHWSIGPIAANPTLAKALLEGPYKRKALIPPSPWLDKKSPTPPDLNVKKHTGHIQVNWYHSNPDDIARWVFYYKHGSQWNYNILGSSIKMDSVSAFIVNQPLLSRSDPKAINKVEDILIPLDSIAVSVVDRFGNESALTSRKVSGISLTDAPSLSEILAKHNTNKTKSVLPKPTVTPGIDLLVTEHIDLIKGKKVGLITNPSAVGADLRSSIDILAGTAGVNLVALFGAEHGVRGALQGKIFQDGDPDPVTGIPVYSMYGHSFAPKKEWLKGLDVLIFDIQGVGSAWYTYKYSMSFAMQACAAAGIPFIVLDRPNPLGGSVVEGPLHDTVSIFRHPLPLRHGMTYGELATMWNETEGYGADLTVIKMKGWRRNMLWNETGLLWVMPSPNMGTLETAIVYPGQCLFERTNISEGRGTTKPFLMTGSTWIDAEKAASDLNSRGIKGVVFRPVHFIPEITVMGSNPRGKPWNKMSHGVEVMVTDPVVFRSVEAAVHTFDVYRKSNPDSLVWSPPAIIKRLEKPGATVEEVLKACQDQVSDFIKIRQKYLLYR